MISPPLLVQGERHSWVVEPPIAYEIVVIAASRGCIDAVAAALGTLTPDFSAPILVVVHLPPDHRSFLREILERRVPLPVHWAKEAQVLRNGHVYLAPPGAHLVISPRRRVRFVRSHRVNFVRPSADVTFESIARGYGSRAIGIVLTGRLHDGARGATLIRRAGGIVIVQDPLTSVEPGMPNAAIADGAPHVILAPERMGAALTSLVMVPGAATKFGLCASATG